MFTFSVRKETLVALKDCIWCQKESMAVLPGITKAQQLAFMTNGNTKYTQCPARNKQVGIEKWSPHHLTPTCSFPVAPPAPQSQWLILPRFHCQSNSQIPFVPPAASAPVQATVFSLLEYCSGLEASLSTRVLAPPTLIQDQSGLNNHCSGLFNQPLGSSAPRIKPGKRSPDDWTPGCHSSLSCLHNSAA